MHLAWYGVPDALGIVPGGTDNCYKNDTDFKLCAADKAARTDGGTPQNAVALAFTAAADTTHFPGADGGVVTDGRSIVIAGAASGPKNMHIPQNQYFSCSGPPGGQRNQNAANNSVPYYMLPNSIVLEPGTWSNPSNLSIWRDANSLLDSCFIRPTWYNEYTLQTLVLGATLKTRALIDNIEHAFVGTATVCGSNPNNPGSTVDGEACSMRDVTCIGFDVCDDSRASPRAVFSDVNYESNVGEFIHNNGGGMKLENANVQNFIEGVLDNASGDDITKASWRITSIVADSTGEALVKIDTSGSTADQIVSGDTVIIGSFVSGSSGPPALNGRWIVKCAALPPTPCGGSTNGFDLMNSSFYGPSTTASWKAGSNVLSVPDTAQIGGGQYLCAPGGTPPFSCTIPSGFGSTGSPTLTANLSAGGNQASVSSTANWPATGLIKIGSGSSLEYIAYAVLNATTIQLTKRGADGFGGSGQAHSSGDAITVAPPTVIATVPSLNKVIVNATATASGSNVSVAFLNDPYFNPSGDCSLTTSTCALLNANYHTWTGLAAAGSTPDGVLATTATGTNTSNVLTVAGNTFKLQPGMLAYDLDHESYLTDSMGNPLQVTLVSGSSVTLSGNPQSSGSFADNVRFAGCGYPGDSADASGAAPAPWLGNCAATAYLFYGVDANHGGAGTACDYIHSHGWRVYMHMNNGQETVCNKMIFDSGSGGAASGGIDNNDTADPTSVGIWVEGDGDKIELADGKVEARTGFLNTGINENNGVGLSNFNFTTSDLYSLVFANSGRSNISQLHGSPSGAGYADSSELGLTLTASDLDTTSVYYDDPTKLSTLHCANNVFATSFCGNLLTHVAAGGTAPVVAAPMTATSAVISGNDNAGRVTFSSGLVATQTLTINFAAPWSTPPVCLAQVESSMPNLGTASSVTTTSVAFKFAGNVTAGQTVSFQCLGFK
ncbi:MAG TPA: hypothetical protein VLC74_13200 [Rhizomicrobium sp.]|nr:hypothetical protein [Rhizomicrobium sp.]